MANIREKLDNLHCGLNSLAVFRNLLNDEVISAFSALLELHAEGKSFDVNIYSEFVSRLYRHNVNLSEYIFKKVCEDENFYISGKSQGKFFDDMIEQAVSNELEMLREISMLTSEELQYGYYRPFQLPQWKTADIDFAAEYKKRIENISCYGCGIFANSTMFILRSGEIVPVKSPDAQRLDMLFGYDRERAEVVENTLALVNGKTAQNTLLYGDAGTGKSSTVKAVVNKYAHKGLRLVEITKEQLRELPELIDKLSGNPLKFIIFIDDLTFTSGEDCFGALKAALEGSVSTRSDNIAIYATSNRRHLVKESFSDREGDDVHRNDTMQELLSLSARFGLRVNFSRPDKKNYTAIALELARVHGIDMPEDELALKAEQFAISSGNGRSPRTARQFINQLRIVGI
ncbi:MAG: ATP-binding protein [Ruminococcus sp.]|nr:ATP-binding protein [Ruminococcus sp.]